MVKKKESNMKRRLFICSLLLVLIATGAAAPQLLGIKVTNTTVKAFFSEVATGNATWVIKDGNNSIVDAGTSAFAAAISDSLDYPTPITAPGSYTLIYNATFLFGGNLTSAAQTVLFAVAAPPPPPQLSTPPGTLNILQPPPGIAIQGNQLVSGTASSPAGVKEVWFVASPTPPPNDDCSKLGGWIRAAGTSAWTGVWAFEDLQNLPGTYYITGKLVDTTGAITACNYVQVIFKLNASLTGTPTPTSTPIPSKTKSLTCVGKPCDCPLRSREFVWMVEPKAVKLSFTVDGKEQTSQPDTDVLRWTPTKDGKYELLIGDKVEKSCYSSTSSAVGGEASDVPDEIKNRVCSPASTRYGALEGTSLYQPSKVMVGDLVRCSFGAEVMYIVEPRGTGRDAALIIDSSVLLKQKNKTVEFIVPAEGTYVIRARLTPTDRWIETAFYKAENSGAYTDLFQWLFFLSLIIGLGVGYMRQPDVGFNERAEEGGGSSQHHEVTNCAIFSKNLKGRSTGEPFAIAEKKKWLHLFGQYAYYIAKSRNVGESPQAELSLRRWLRGEQVNFINPQKTGSKTGEKWDGYVVVKEPMNSVRGGYRIYDHYFLGATREEAYGLIRDLSAHITALKGGTPEELVVDKQRMAASKEAEELKKLRKEVADLSGGMVRMGGEKKEE